MCKGHIFTFQRKSLIFPCKRTNLNDPQESYFTDVSFILVANKKAALHTLCMAPFYINYVSHTTLIRS